MKVVTIINTDNFEIRIHPTDEGIQYGWFDHNEHGDEYGGSLDFQDRELVDYDGISGYLPNEILDALEGAGFDVNEMRPREEAC